MQVSALPDRFIYVRNKNTKKPVSYCQSIIVNMGYIEILSTSVYLLNQNKTREDLLKLCLALIIQ